MIVFINTIQMLTLAATAFYLLQTAHFRATRLTALLPLAMAAMDFCSLRADFFEVFLLGALMVCLRLTVLLCCFAAIKKDKAMTKARARERALRRMRLHTTVSAERDCACYA